MEVYKIWLQIFGIIMIFLSFFLIIPLSIFIRRCIIRYYRNRDETLIPLRNNIQLNTV